MVEFVGWVGAILIKLLGMAGLKMKGNECEMGRRKAVKAKSECWGGLIGN